MNHLLVFTPAQLSQAMIESATVRQIILNMLPLPSTTAEGIYRSNIIEETRQYILRNFNPQLEGKIPAIKHLRTVAQTHPEVFYAAGLKESRDGMMGLAESKKLVEKWFGIN